MPSSTPNESAISLLKANRIAEAIYLLLHSTEEENNARMGKDFLLGIALCNTRLDCFLLLRYVPDASNCLAQLDPYYASTGHSLIADPKMLHQAYQHFAQARDLGFIPDSWEESLELQQRTADLLLTFIRIELRDPHRRSYKVTGTSLRVIQVAFLCLVQLSEKFIPLEEENIPNFQSYLAWARSNQ